MRRYTATANKDRFAYVPNAVVVGVLFKLLCLLPRKVEKVRVVHHELRDLSSLVNIDAIQQTAQRGCTKELRSGPGGITCPCCRVNGMNQVESRTFSSRLVRRTAKIEIREELDTIETWDL